MSKPANNKEVICKDGFSMSVQAQRRSYCSPKLDFADRYIEVEVGFPSEIEPTILKYAENKQNPTGTVYGYVPVDLVRHIIDKHGGIKSGEVPKGVPVYGITHSQSSISDA